MDNLKSLGVKPKELDQGETSKRRATDIGLVRNEDIRGSLIQSEGQG